MRHSLCLRELGMWTSPSRLLLVGDFASLEEFSTAGAMLTDELQMGFLGELWYASKTTKSRLRAKRKILVAIISRVILAMFWFAIQTVNGGDVVQVSLFEALSSTSMPSFESQASLLIHPKGHDHSHLA